jgi:hypothetical protein
MSPAQKEQFEELARRWKDENGQPEPDPKKAVSRMVLDYFSPCDIGDLANLHHLLLGLREAALEKRNRKRPTQAKQNDDVRRPDPKIIRQNAASFEELALKWRNSLTGEIAYNELGLAVLYMILDYFDCDNSSGLYFRDVLEAIAEKLRLQAIKGGLEGLPQEQDLGSN